jgi:transcriptional regulator GlxA family with amidase domain
MTNRDYSWFSIRRQCRGRNDFTNCWPGCLRFDHKLPVSSRHNNPGSLLCEHETEEREKILSVVYVRRMESKTTTGILVFEQAEELDFVGPYEVFGMAAEFDAPCQIVVIAESLQAIRCAHGLRILPDHTMENAPALDLLIVPGGKGARLHAQKSPEILEFVRRQKGTVASVCTGAIVLAAAGVLNGMDATTHVAHYAQLREYDRVKVREGVRFVMHDRIATSAGVTAGIDLALAFVARFFGQSLAGRIAQNLEWESVEWRSQTTEKNKPPRE